MRAAAVAARLCLSCTLLALPIAGLSLHPTPLRATARGYPQSRLVTPRSRGVVVALADASDEPEPEPQPITLRERLRLFWRLAVPYFEQVEGARLDFGLLLLLVVADAGISVTFSFVGRDFYDALEVKNQALFLEKTANFAACLAVATPVTVLFKFQLQRLALNWRQWMTTELARQYYSDRTYYKVEIDSEIDNPDQRITEDVTSFTRLSLDFAITLLTSIIDLISFSGILYSIYPQLFYVIFVYASFGSITTVKLGRALVGQNAEQLLREANLRYALVRFRENAESIAFYQGEAQEEEKVSARLGGIVENKRALLGTQRNLEFFTVGYVYLIQILPVLVVSPLYFAGTVQLGVITQSSGAFNSILDDLSLIVNEFEGLSRFSAGLNRLATFVERMESYQSEPGNGTFALNNTRLDTPTQAVEGRSTAAGNTGELPPLLSPSADPAARFAAASLIDNQEVADLTGGMVLSISNLSLVTPDGSRLLFANVSFEVAAGEHLLVTGTSGSGKSSMLRALAGLWTRGAGSVTRPLTTDTMFLPQRPYCTLGTLRQQLVYPNTVEEFVAAKGTDDTLLRALRTVQLSELADGGAVGLDGVRDWSDELSLGEQQRLAFARVLIRQPKLAILDEATSALDLTTEAAMYAALAALPGISYLSVGHRPSLENFHHTRLRLFGMDPSQARAGSPPTSYGIKSIRDLRRMREARLLKRSVAASAASDPLSSSVIAGVDPLKLE